VAYFCWKSCTAAERFEKAVPPCAAFCASAASVRLLEEEEDEDDCLASELENPLRFVVPLLLLENRDEVPQLGRLDDEEDDEDPLAGCEKPLEVEFDEPQLDFPEEEEPEL
jgi:hypothetical protein